MEAASAADNRMIKIGMTYVTGAHWMPELPWSVWAVGCYTYCDVTPLRPAARIRSNANVYVKRCADIRASNALFSACAGGFILIGVSLDTIHRGTTMFDRHPIQRPRGSPP